MGLLLRNGPSVRKFQALFGVERFPHGDTLEATFSNLETDQIQMVVTGMTETLIRKKVLYSYRLLGIYFIVAIDGTGTISFSRRHCPHCLTRTRNGKTLYYHPVLEAKLVTSNGFAFSLMTEFIENPGDKATKQDCELKAFYRLAERLKTRFPRLPILLSMDGLFAGGPTFDLCQSLRLEVHDRSEGRRFALRERGVRCAVQITTREPVGLAHGEGGPNQTGLPLGRRHRLCRFPKEGAHVIRDRVLGDQTRQGGTKKTTKFKWVTNCHVSCKNVTTLSNDGGRMRWKIENEGFNVQKKGGYELEHAYTNHPNSAKVFYFLLQIAHLLAQLLYKANLLKRDFPDGFGSAKNLAFRLLEAWRNARMTQADITAALQKRFQIRFDSS